MRASSPVEAVRSQPQNGPVFIRRPIQGVDYYHAQTATGGDLFLTEYGLPWAAHLQPEQWLENPWFEDHRRRLRGTSTIYLVPTKPVHGRTLNLVVRFSRMGEDLPVDTVTRACYTHATFNTPFEEVAELMALRGTRFGPKQRLIPTKRPLAIYSPPTRLELWQTQRNPGEILVKQARLTEVELDAHRSYLLIYGWIKGIDVQDAADRLGLGGAARSALLRGAMAEVEQELKAAGFRELDMKPAHIIVRFNPHGQLLRRPDGRLVYALIDYELLERDPQPAP